MRLRKPLRVFAVTMENRLRANDHKIGWEACTHAWLLRQLKKNITRMRIAHEFVAIHDGNTMTEPLRKKWREKVINDAADIANFAMMIADNQRRAMEER